MGVGGGGGVAKMSRRLHTCVARPCVIGERGALVLLPAEGDASLLYKERRVLTYPTARPVLLSTLVARMTVALMYMHGAIRSETGQGSSPKPCRGGLAVRATSCSRPTLLWNCIHTIANY